MGRSDIVDELKEIAGKAAEDSGTELVHIEMSGSGPQTVLRVFIDKEGGVDHDDCSAVSQALEKELDARDPIRGRYVLEVSSPGIERGLYSLQDFEKYKGQKAKLKTSVPVDGQKNFRGTIEGVRNGDIAFDDRTSGKVVLPWTSISKANLEFDVGEELKRSKKRRF